MTRDTTQEEAIAAAEIKFPDCVGTMIQGKIKKFHTVVRYTYPRMDEVFADNKKETKRIEVTGHGRPFVFHRKDFVREEDNIIVSQEDIMINSMNINRELIKADDMPF